MHQITLPEPRRDIPLAFQTPEQARAWLANQPQTQPLLMLTALHQQIEAIDAAPLPPATTLALLNILRKAAAPQQASNEIRYIRKALPLLPDDQRSFEAAHTLWTHLGIAYLRLTSALTASDKNLALNRAACAFRMAQYCHFQAACECPPQLDELLLTTLTLAGENDALLQALPDPDFPHLGEAHTAGHLTWAFLLRLIDPYRLSAAQLTVANRALSRWRELAIFQPDADNAAKGLTINLELIFGALVPTASSHWLNVRAVSRKIRNRIDALKAGETPEGLKLGRELTAAACIRLLDQLANCLQPQKKLGATEIGEIELCFGAEHAYTVITEEALNPHSSMDPKAATLAHQRMAMFGFDRLSQMPSAVRKLNVPGEVWNMVDGKAIRSLSEECTRRVSPCLIAARPNNQPRLGVMTGLQTTANGVLAADLVWFDGELEPCWLKRRLTHERDSPKQAAFVLRSPGSLSLIVAGTTTVPLATQLTLEGAKICQVLPIEVIERGADYVRYACEMPAEQ